MFLWLSHDLIELEAECVRAVVFSLWFNEFRWRSLPPGTVLIARFLLSFMPSIWWFLVQRERFSPYWSSCVGVLLLSRWAILSKALLACPFWQTLILLPVSPPLPRCCVTLGPAPPPGSWSAMQHFKSIQALLSWQCTSARSQGDFHAQTSLRGAWPAEVKPLPGLSIWKICCFLFPP